MRNSPKVVNKVASEAVAPPEKGFMPDVGSWIPGGVSGCRGVFGVVGRD